MIGIKLTLNGDKVISAATEGGNLSLIIDTRESPSLYLNGSDIGFENISWLDENIKTGDKIKVEIVEMNVISEPIARKPRNISRLLEQYETLKTELEDEKLL